MKIVRIYKSVNKVNGTFYQRRAIQLAEQRYENYAYAKNYEVLHQ